MPDIDVVKMTAANENGEMTGRKTLIISLSRHRRRGRKKALVRQLARLERRRKNSDSGDIKQQKRRRGAAYLQQKTRAFSENSCAAKTHIKMRKFASA
jgi:hypothetical protein